MDKIAELKAKYDAANDALRAAKMAESEARQAWRDAILDATGLRGHIIESRRGRFVVSGLSPYTNSYVTGYLIKKDGKLGERKADCAISSAVSLGLYSGQVQ